MKNFILGIIHLFGAILLGIFAAQVFLGREVPGWLAGIMIATLTINVLKVALDYFTEPQK